ncbi:MAG: glycosyltransferase family 39 protein, partial [Candidatus Coatesbacteria bacterium]|nr:glycosyltransferase family 39 protein [Candidatus Coatesbacteria bacterium]
MPDQLELNLVTAEDRRSRWRGIIVAAIFLAGLALRVWGLKWALPAVIHHDERNVALSVLKGLFSGNLCPQFYYYPSLSVLSHYLAASAAYIVGNASGLFAKLTDLRVQDYLPYARLISALSGALTVLVVTKTAMAIRKDAAIPAAVVSAFGSLSTLHSHYATPDASLVLFIQLALLFAMLSIERESMRLNAWAAAFSAVAASFKYTGVLAIIPVLIAACTIKSSLRRRTRLAIPAVVATVVFAALNIGAIFDLPTLFDHLRFEALHYFKAGNLGIINTASENPGGIVFHLRAMLGDIGYIAAGFALFGIIVSFTFRSGRRYLAVAMTFAIPHLILFSSARAAFPRNILPVTPILTVFAGVAIAWFVASFKTTSVRPKVAVLTMAF